MNVLIVYAHQEPKSFNHSMKELAVRTLTGAGHHVQVSDLYAMDFKAEADRCDFDEMADADFFKYQLEQVHAFHRGTLAPDIQEEQQKLLWCDALILQFPLWWFSLPAILKGWVDRVFSAGFAYGAGKWYDQGGLRGRRAMLALTTGGPASVYGRDGMNGNIHEILFHINHGMLYFTGFDVLPPFIAWSVARVTPEQREKYLEEYKERLLTLETATPLLYRSMDDYDDTAFMLKPAHHE
jgi:NAD(P)H dehydrogenase (quinone)